MSTHPRISLEQWRTLVAVVDAGGYAQAAQALNKSQSAVTYALQKLERVLGVRAFRIEGRKAVLTPTGELLYRRAQALIEEARSLELSAQRVSAGWEAELRVGVEVIFPMWLMLDSLARFGRESPHTRVELVESVLGGVPEALQAGELDLALTPHVPSGFVGEALMRLRFLPVASPAHPLHAIQRPLTLRDLRQHRHVVVRDQGSKRTTANLWLEAKQRWTVSYMSTSITAVCAGHGFAWLPEEKIRDELADGRLKPLVLRDGSERFADMYLIFADRGSAGPGLLRLAELLRDAACTECPKSVVASGDR